MGAGGGVASHFLRIHPADFSGRNSDLELEIGRSEEEKAMENTNARRETQVAYLLFRVLLGTNICLHGMTRLAAGESKFRGTIVSQFAHTVIPHSLLVAFAYSLPWAEAMIGFLLTLGLLTPVALIAGLLVMILLTFGTSLVQDWQTAGLQLIYGISYAALLFLLPYNKYSLDSAMRRNGKFAAGC